MMGHSPLDVARSYFRRGWIPLSVPYRSKNPGFKDWQNHTVTEAELPQHFNGKPQNIGVLLGKASGDLVDVDLDCPEVVSLAPRFLPTTGAVFGRETNPRSHHLFVASLQSKVTFTNPITKKRLLELLTNGQQSIFPGSVHEGTGELVRWYEEGEPAHVSEADLRQAAQRLAAATLLACHWPQEGSRQDAALALAGGLLRAGWSEDEAAHFIEAVCAAAGDEETRARVKTVCYTLQKLTDGAHATGWPTLAKLIDQRIVDKVREWLNIGDQGQSRSAGEQEGNPTAEAHGYLIKDGCLARKKITNDGWTLVKLCNFTAVIASDCTEDDGASERRVYEVRGNLAGRELSHSISVCADEFGAMRWVDRLLGAQATVYPAQSEHVRCAIRLLSEDIAEARVFTHTGWRRIGEECCYLHGGGAICATGNRADVTVRLPPSLDPFKLPDAPEGETLIKAVRQHLDALAVASARVSFPLFGGVWAAVSGNCDFAEHLSGESGAGKSELAAIAQAHFGAGFDREHLPAAWASTGNSLERLAHAAKDALLVVDDFAPTGSANDTARLHREADRLLRAQGNHAGRLRLRSDTTFNAARAPRGLILSTGEDVPRGQSLRARLCVLEVEKATTTRAGTIDFTLLTKCQNHARDGIYASVMAAYLRWLSARYENVAASATEVIAQLRNEFSASINGHKRHATTAAKLMRAWNLFFDFAAEVGALDDYERDSLTRQAWAALLAAAQAQEEQQASQDMAVRFVELIAAALSTGGAHVAELDGSRPDFNQSMYGWRDDIPQGKRIGWKDEANLYLQPDIAFGVANELSSRTGSGLTITPTTLWKRMNERGWLIVEPSQDSLKLRVTAERGRQRVIALRLPLLGAGDASEDNLSNPSVGSASPGGTGSNE